MEDLFTRISRLTRPKLLVRTAKAGLADYDRRKGLRRLLKSEPPPGSGAAILRLMDIENTLNDQRCAKRAEYSPTRHIDLLIAIMAEAEHLRQKRPISLTSAPCKPSHETVRH